MFEILFIHIYIYLNINRRKTTENWQNRNVINACVKVIGYVIYNLKKKSDKDLE